VVVKSILIVIPTYNEVANVAVLFRSIDAAFQRQSVYKADTLFVDDNSPDGTAQLIQKLGSTKKKNIYLLSGPKEGLGKAYIRGLTYGMKLKTYFAIVTMDADLSHDPADIPRLLAELDKGADYVIGSRYVAGGRTVLRYSLLRRLQSAAANLVAKYFVDIKIDVRDLTSGFKAIRSSALKQIPLQNISASGYVFQVNMLYEFAKHKFVVREVPITFRARKHGKSKLTMRDATEFLRLTFRLNPHARLPRVARFAGVGASGTIVNVALLVSLVRLAHLDITAAYLIALEASIISNFTLNHLFTFRFLAKRRRKGKGLTVLVNKLGRYNLVSVGGVAIALTTFTLTYHKLGLNYIIADLLGIVAGMSWNYWFSTKLVWRIVDDDTPASADNFEQSQET
jgi:dolichol-phosphate mannosyltransferase